MRFPFLKERTPLDSLHSIGKVYKTNNEIKDHKTHVEYLRKKRWCENIFEKYIFFNNWILFVIIVEHNSTLGRSK